MVEAEGLTKRFKDVLAVDRATFSVERGTVFGLLGENGAGKTTTLRMLATLLRPTEGTATVNGHDLLEEPELVRRSLGVLFEGGVYDRLTARENIRYFGQLHGVDSQRLERRIEELLELLKMREFADRRVGGLSKGMRQKVAIARALVHDPPVLLMDEPTAGLDVTAARIVHEFVQEAGRSGRTVIFSSHNMNEVEKLCHRVAVIHRGRIVACGTVAALRDRMHEQNLEEAFVKLVGDRV